MTTRKLYHEDTGLLETTARVLDLRRDGGGWSVVPDRTVIFPGGGGQPGDLGWVEDAPVRESVTEGEAVIHRLDTLPPGVAEGATVRLRVDGTRRRESAQQHTGQHIVSAALLEIAGIQTVSVHMGDDTMTVESPVSAIDEETLGRVQARANRVIQENHPVLVHVVGPDELERFRLRRPAAPRDTYRLVEIEGYDVSACGGVHVAKTAEVGLVIRAGSERIRRNTRTHWLVGDRAWRHYESSSDLVGRLGHLLSATPDAILEATQALKQTVTELERRAAALEQAAARAHADRLVAAAPSGSVLTQIFEGLDRGVFRTLALELSRRQGVVAILANREGATAQLAACRGPGRAGDLGGALHPHLGLAGATGGGKGGLWQGVARRPDGLEAFLEAATPALEGL